MEADQITAARLALVEARMAALEQRLANLESGTGTRTERKPRNLTPQQRQDIRDRLVAGQERKRLEREAEAKKNEKPKTTSKKKEASSGTPAK